MNDYQEFLSTKSLVHPNYGKEVSKEDIHPLLFDFQNDLTRWALRKGRAAIFADTGLGKTLMQLVWANLLKERTLIIAPLTVARQTVKEAEKLGLMVHYTRTGAQLNGNLNITNYEMIEKFNPKDFGAIVLDESSILKSLTGKTRKKVTKMFSDTPYKLCCTATPAPNDIAEIANHAEFLGIMTRTDMMAAFFVHDDDGWRLKGHAEEPFYRWLASWGMSVKKPSDLGYDDGDFILPPLTVEPVFVQSNYCPPGQLFFTGLKGIQDRIAVRRATLESRVNAAAEMVNSDDDQWIVWCGLNPESHALSEAIPDSIEVSGSDNLDKKIHAIEGFQNGKYRVLVTKPKIAGFGMNFQHSHKMAFVGLSDSWESYYQCIRRQYRFMQEYPVEVYVFLADVEDAVWQNVMKKERQANRMSEQLIEHVKEFEKAEVGMTQLNGFTYEEDSAQGSDWKMMLGDSVERMSEIEDESIDLSVFSPPFLSLYTYSPTERDVGNCKTNDEFFGHFGYIIDHLLRVTKEGRICAVHCADVAAMLVRDGYIGVKDFSGLVIQNFENHGWIYHGRVTIDKNPQAVAIRTHAKGLAFGQLEKDSSWLRPALADYILIFRKPGENQVPVKSDIDRDTWIKWAHPIWYGIRETDTLQYWSAREYEDERHIAPLQLETIERCIRLWSNPGELICDPFAGIGSTGYVALKLGRRFVGIELKKSYYRQAVANLQSVEKAQVGRLF